MIILTYVRHSRYNTLLRVGTNRFIGCAGYTVVTNYPTGGDTAELLDSAF